MYPLNETHKAVLDATGDEVNAGDHLRDFRGDLWEFLGITKASGGANASTGRIHVRDCNEPTWDETCYPSVFDIVIVPRKDIITVDIPLTGTDQTKFGSVGTVEYRDTLGGVRYTAHITADGTAWITRHSDHTGASDGPAVAKSPLLHGMPALDAAWNDLRGY